MPADEKYVVFKRSEWEKATVKLDRADVVIPLVEDAVVIRKQDMFATVPTSQIDAFIDTVGATVAERDAAITRAETAEAMHRYLEDRANNARRALAEAVELLRRWQTRDNGIINTRTHMERVSQLLLDTSTWLARQAVTEEPE